MSGDEVEYELEYELHCATISPETNRVYTLSIMCGCKLTCFQVKLVFSLFYIEKKYSR